MRGLDLSKVLLAVFVIAAGNVFGQVTHNEQGIYNPSENGDKTFNNRNGKAEIQIYVVGGGGGGGGGDTGKNSIFDKKGTGGGGGGGGAAYASMTVSGSTTYSINVGGGGAPGSNGNASGGGHSTVWCRALDKSLDAYGGGGGGGGGSGNGGGGGGGFWSNIDGHTGTNGNKGTSGKDGEKKTTPGGDIIKLYGKGLIPTFPTDDKIGNGGAGGYATTGTWGQGGQVQIRVIYLYDVTFNYNYNNSPASVSITDVANGTTISSNKVPTPARTGYRFDGWYTAQTGGTIWTTDTRILENTSKIYYARWTPLHTVTFNYNYTPNSPASVSITDILNGTTIPSNKLPSTPARTGYRFDGWYTTAQTGGTEWTANTQIMASITYYARWTPITYSISYSLDGGTNHSSNPANYTFETPIITLQSPTREHYTFAGWWSAQTGGSQVTTINKGSTENKTFYARWTPIIYTVTFDLHGGLPNLTSIEIHSGNFVAKPADPTKTGHVFACWAIDEDGASQWNFANNPVTANITLHAIWENADNMIILPDAAYIYDGLPKKLGTIMFIPLGSKYRITLFEDADFDAEYENNINSGTASVTITLKDEDYESVGTVEKQFTIRKREIPVSWKNTRLVWNDELQHPTPSPVLNADKGFIVDVDSITWRKNVGINYVARAFCPDTNVTISEGKEEFYDIEKRGINVMWGNERSFVYDKREHAPIATAQIDFGGGRVMPVQLWVPNRRIAAGEYTSQNNAAAIAEITAAEISDNAYLTGNTNTCNFVIEKKPLKVRLKDTPPSDTINIENGEDFASEEELENYLTGLLEYDGFATDEQGNSDNVSVLQGNSRVRIREVENNNNQRSKRSTSLVDLIRLYEVMIETETVRADNYTPQGQEGVILSITSFLGMTGNKNIEKSDDRYGIRITGSNIVSDKAEISVILPNKERVVEVKAVIYDNTGNVVWSEEQAGAKLTWDLKNIAGKNVANGSYLIIAESKDRNGNVYRYSAKVGVKR